MTSEETKTALPKEADESMTCDALCRLSTQSSSSCPDDTKPAVECGGDIVAAGSCPKKKNGGRSCPKQLQLPMFLSKTYHMVDKCDPEVATWSENGDNFVIKNVETFSSEVLCKYFKHSNFSSFARQLNFYGFRKLRTDPILMNEVDTSTAPYVRFYHENFQRDNPELLQRIKRATKTDQQSKDDVDQLKVEIKQLKNALESSVKDYDRKLAELSYECNRRITSMNAEYDKLLAVVQTALPNLAALGNASNVQPPASLTTSNAALHSLSQAAVSLQVQSKKRPADDSMDVDTVVRPKPN